MINYYLSKSSDLAATKTDIGTMASKLNKFSVSANDLSRIEFGHETGDPDIAKHFISFWHLDGTKTVLSFNAHYIFCSYWDGAKWTDKWVK